MKKEWNCKIVQDLLPSYIENLTNEETNVFIKEHLEECEECRKIYNNMKNKINIKDTNREKREIKYIKKYNNKMRVLQVILLAILVIFIINTGRKMIIISNLSKKAEEYTKSNNFYRTVYSYQQEKYEKTEIYSLNDKKLVIMTKVDNGNKSVIRMYKTGDDTVNLYVEDENGKTAKLNQKTTIVVNIPNALYTDNLGQFVYASIFASIKSDKCNGKDCYFITDNSDNFLMYAGTGYIDKDTGLLTRIPADESAGGATIDYEYEFNTVTEEDFIEPDLSEYKVEKQ